MICTSTPGELVTDRRLLREWTDADVAAVVGGTRMPDWASDYPADGDQVIAGILAAEPRDSAARGVYGQRQIIEQATGQVIGGVGLFWPPTEGVVEFGYGVVASRRGRGYATEAARAIVDLALAADGISGVSADVELANPASAQVLELLADLGLARVSDVEGIAHYATG